MKSHEAPIHTYTNCEVNVHTRSHQPYAGVLKGMRRGRGAVTQNAPHHGTTPRTDAGQHLLRRNASQAALHDTLGGLRAWRQGPPRLRVRDRAGRGEHEPVHALAARRRGQAALVVQVRAVAVRVWGFIGFRAGVGRAAAHEQRRLGRHVERRRQRLGGAGQGGRGGQRAADRLIGLGSAALQQHREHRQAPCGPPGRWGLCRLRPQVAEHAQPSYQAMHTHNSAR